MIKTYIKMAVCICILFSAALAMADSKPSYRIWSTDKQGRNTYQGQARWGDWGSAGGKYTIWNKDRKVTGYAVPNSYGSGSKVYDNNNRYIGNTTPKK